MGTQRLDFSYSFPRLEVPISQPARPAGFSISDWSSTFEGKGNCNLKRNVCVPSLMANQTAIWVPSDRWEKRKNLKRYSEPSSSEESCINRSKRMRGSSPECTVHGDDFFADLFGGLDFYLSEPMKPESMVGVPISFSTPPPIVEDVQFTTSSIESLLPNANWVESVVTEISVGGDDKDEFATSETPKDSDSNSSSSETHNSIQQEDDSSEKGTATVSNLPRQSGNTETGDENFSTDGLELVNLLVSCSDAVSCKNFALVNHYLCKLGELASPIGTTIHRVAAYFTEAMSLRVANLWPHIFKFTPRDLGTTEEEILTSFRLLNEVSPIPKFLQFTANEMILKAIEGKDKIHIIDLDIKHGLQWPALFHSLVSRPNPPSHVRITGVGESRQELQETGDRLARFAETMNLPFQFHAVADKLEDLRLWMLHVKCNESVAVNCMMQMHRVINDGNGSSLRDFLGLMQSVRPAVLVVAEQESSHNELSWEDRFCNSLEYYSAIFDSINSSLAQDSPARTKIEEIFAREIQNIIACEGSERTERHQNFDKWKAVMAEGGFRCLGIDEREVMQSKMLLRMFPYENYNVVKQGEEGLTLCWLQQPLYSVSAWTAAMDIAGTSSTFS